MAMHVQAQAMHTAETSQGSQGSNPNQADPEHLLRCLVQPATDATTDVADGSPADTRQTSQETEERAADDSALPGMAALGPRKVSIQRSAQPDGGPASDPALAPHAPAYVTVRGGVAQPPTPTGKEPV